MQVFAVRLDADQRRVVDCIAQAKRVSRGVVIRWAIDHYRRSLSVPFLDTPAGADPTTQLQDMDIQPEVVPRHAE